MNQSLTILLLSLYLCCSQLNAQTHNNKSLKGVDVVATLPYNFVSKGIDQNNDTIAYFLRNDTVLIRHSYHFTFLSEEEESPTEVRYRFFAYKKGEAKGIWMEGDSLTTSFDKGEDSVNTVLSRFKNGIQKPLETLLRDSARLVDLLVTPETVRKKYVFKNHQHKMGGDSILLEFNKKFNDIDYYLSDYTTLLNGMKLYKYNLIVQCDEAISLSQPDFAIIRFGIYLSEPLPSALKAAEKYLSLASVLTKRKQ